MELTELEAWLDRHHVAVIRTHATTLDGASIGKHLHRNKFIRCLPQGHGISDTALTMNLEGTPHVTQWHPDREANLGDIFLQPDLSTLIYDGPDPDLGHCICNFVNAAGEPLDLCPRSMLQHATAQLLTQGYTMRTTCELEFFIFQDSFDSLRQRGYRSLGPVTANQFGGIYQLRNAYRVKPFMNELIQRLEWKHIEWESWNDENGSGQVELNLSPLDPVAMADTVVRTKEMIYETALDLGMSATFMASIGDVFSSGMHIHHSLVDANTGEPAFFDPDRESQRAACMEQWLAGLLATLPGAVSYLCPTVNSYRRFRQFTAAPTVANWGEDNKTAAIRTLTRGPAGTRIEHRVGAADLNPYLALAVIIAGGLGGLRHQLTPPSEYTGLAWGNPESPEDLPSSITAAAKALQDCPLLKESLGEVNLRYWAKTREAEWLAFHNNADGLSRDVQPWEFKRYFELI